MTRDELIDLFCESLIEVKKYPKETLVHNYSIGKGYFADILIVDRREVRPLALIEFMESPDKSLDLVSKKIQRYLDALGEYIPFYIVSTNESGFEICKYDSEQYELVKIDFDRDFPDYFSLVTGTAVAEVQQRIMKRGKSVDYLKFTCYGLAVVLVALLGLTKAKLIEITSDDVIVMGMIVALCLIPHAAEFKLMGVEYKAKPPEEESTDK